MEDHQYPPTLFQSGTQQVYYPPVSAAAHKQHQSQLEGVYRQAQNLSISIKEEIDTPLRVSPTPSPTTSISSFACSPSDMQIIESIISQNPLPKINKTHSCMHCGRISANQALNLIHEDESCLLNPNSKAQLSRKSNTGLTSMTSLDTSSGTNVLTEVNSKQSKERPKKLPTTKRKNKSTKEAVEEDDAFAESIISSILSPTLKKSTQRKTPSKKKIATAPMHQILGTKSLQQASSVINTAQSGSNMTPGLLPLATSLPSEFHGNNSMVSLWVPVVSDITQLASAMFNSTKLNGCTDSNTIDPNRHYSNFTLQRSRVHKINNQQLLKLMGKKPISFSSKSSDPRAMMCEWVSHGIDHNIRTSLAGRRRLAAVSSASTSLIPPSSSMSYFPPTNSSNLVTSKAPLSSFIYQQSVTQLASSQPVPNIVQPSLSSPGHHQTSIFNIPSSSSMITMMLPTSGITQGNSMQNNSLSDSMRTESQTIKKKSKGYYPHHSNQPATASLTTSRHHHHLHHAIQQSPPSISRLATASTLSMPEI